MFYSYEILTQRKYGVATVWLIATLGSKSSLKRVQRKDILSVNVRKACDTIIRPEAPMALRLQSNLLFGVARCFSQQCQYFYQDVTHVHANLRKVYSASSVNTANLDLAAGKTRSDQLVLPDDPSFLPGADLPSIDDLLDNNLVTRNLLDDSLFTVDQFSGSGQRGLLSQSSFSLPGGDGASHIGSVVGRGNVPPTSDTGAGGDGGGFALPLLDELEFFADADFEFGEDGMMRDVIPRTPNPRTSLLIDKEGGTGTRLASSKLPTRGRPGSDSLLSQVQHEHDGGLQQNFNLGELDSFQLPLLLGDEFDIPRFRDEGGGHQDELQQGQGPAQDLAEKVIELPLEDERDDNAPLTKKRTRKMINDQVLELNNKVLIQWRDGYLQNMAIAVKDKRVTKDRQKAKVQANKLIFQHGIGGELIHPALNSLFAGKSLIEMLKEARLIPGGESQGSRKRTTPHDDDAEDTQRRVRQRRELGDELGLGFQGNGDGMPVFDRDGIEIARDAAGGDGLDTGSLLDNNMPWDRYSLTGSVGRHQGRNTIFSSGGVSGGLNLGGLGGASIFSSSIHGGSQLGDHGRRPRVNASPLLGRGRRSLGSLGIDNGLGIDGHILSGKDDEELYLGAGEDDPQLPLGGDDNLDPYGDNYMTQPADGSTQWLNATMERESYNFLEYLRNELSSRLDEPVFDATNPTLRAITLDQLVPPKESRVIVAAQAMHHTLLLATKGLIRVRQEKAFGDIYLMMPQSQVPRLGNGEDELEEGAEVEEEPLGTTPVPERRREMSLRD